MSQVSKIAALIFKKNFKMDSYKILHLKGRYTSGLHCVIKNLNRTKVIKPVYMYNFDM